jgi:hypothetical protein
MPLPLHVLLVRVLGSGIRVQEFGFRRNVEG